MHSRRRFRPTRLALALALSVAIVVGCSDDAPVTAGDAGTALPRADAASVPPDATPTTTSDAAFDAQTTVQDAGGDGDAGFRGPTCSPACATGKSCTYLNTCVTSSSCNPADVGISCDPGVVGEWWINGHNKINKLEKVILCVHKNVTATVYDTQSKQLFSIQDVFCKKTNFNELLATGSYYMEFYDNQGNFIVIPQDLQETLDIKN